MKLRFSTVRQENHLLLSGFRNKIYLQVFRGGFILHSVSLKPFVKWAGGKSQLIDELEKILPNGDEGDTTLIKSGKGGGNTRTGLVFEGKTDLSTFLNSQPHYRVAEHNIYFDNKKVAVFKYEYYN